MTNTQVTNKGREILWTWITSRTFYRGWDMMRTWSRISIRVGLAPIYNKDAHKAVMLSRTGDTTLHPLREERGEKENKIKTKWRKKLEKNKTQSKKKENKRKRKGENKSWKYEKRKRKGNGYSWWKEKKRKEKSRWSILAFINVVEKK